MTCQNCIHYKVCTYSPLGKVCADFKDKSKIIELPCKVGDKVYTARYGECHCFEVRHISIEHDYDKYGCHIHAGITEFLEKEDFGKTVFLSREKAEAKLKEMQNEN